MIELLNFTPHKIQIKCENGMMDYEVIGNLRLKAENQVTIETLPQGIIVRNPQKFIGLDIPDILNDSKERHILVSMPVGEWLAAHPEVLPNVKVYGPDTGPSQVIRRTKEESDEKNKEGEILGSKSVVRYR